MSSFQIRKYLENNYANAFLISIQRNKDLEDSFQQSEEELCELYNHESCDDFIEQAKGIIFLELLARNVGSSLIELLCFREFDKETILREIIDSVSQEDAEYTYYFEGEFEVEFSAFFKENKFLFRRIDSDNGRVYRLELDRTNNPNHSKFIPEKFCVREETSGFLADFIEMVIEKRHQMEESSVNDEQMKNTMFQNMNTINQRNQLDEELIAYVFNDTGSVDLMDQFEGIGDYKGSPAFKRIVVRNKKYHELFGTDVIGYNLVIERSSSGNDVGDITFTEFKQGKDYGLKEHIKKEITPEIKKEYLDKDRFYRFKKPYLLRAQNSSNRVGYGWKWDWSGGYGNYTEGTEYGETTHYVFAGAYITSLYQYEENQRAEFVENRAVPLEDVEYKIVPYHGQVKDVAKNNTKTGYVLVGTEGNIGTYEPVQVDSASNIIYVPVEIFNGHKEVFMGNTLVLLKGYGTKAKEVKIIPSAEIKERTKNSVPHDTGNMTSNSEDAEYQVVLYEDTASDIAKNPLTHQYILAGRKGSITSYISTYVDSIAHILYVASDRFKDNREVFSQSTVILHQGINSKEDQEIRIRVSSLHDKSSEEGGTPAYSILLYDNASAEIKTNLNREYVYAEKDDHTTAYIPVWINEDDKRLYIEEKQLQDHQEVFSREAVQICKGFNSAAHRIRIQLNLPDSLGSDEGGIRKSLNNADVRFINTNQFVKQPIKNKPADRIAVVKFGDYCPLCGKSNSRNHSITVTDNTGRFRVIQARKCSCGKVYLTRTQQKKLPPNVDYELVDGVIRPWMAVPKAKKNKPSRMVVCPKCKTSCTSLFGDKGMCWDCYKEEMDSRFE